MIAVRAQETQERERCALLRQNLLRENPRHEFTEIDDTAESAMSRTINNIGLTSEDCHIPAVYPASSGITNEPEMVLQCADELTKDKASMVSDPTDSVANITSTEGDITSMVANINSTGADITSTEGNINSTSCLYAKHVAMMAVARSQQMVALSEDTFGDDDRYSDDDNDI